MVISPHTTKMSLHLKTAAQIFSIFELNSFSSFFIMSWNAYLADLKNSSSGCAIITLQGALCAQEGSWSAKQAEIQQWGTYFAANSPATATGVFYNGEKFFCNQAGEETIVAMKGKNALVLHKAATCYVAGFTDGSKFVPAELSSHVAKAAAQLKEVGY